MSISAFTPVRLLTEDGGGDEGLRRLAFDVQGPARGEESATLVGFDDVGLNLLGGDAGVHEALIESAQFLDAAKFGGSRGSG